MKNIYKMLTGIMTILIASASIGTTIPTKTATAGHSDFIVPLFSGYVEDKQVLSHCPDLVIVCFGLNDINGKLDTYLNSLRVIFSKIKESGADIIFMTPNMLNTYVAEDTPKRFFEYAQKTAKMQNDGTMDLYINEAISLARELQIPVSDCYSQWKELSKTKDTTMLLANRINHPISEMHELFADSLMEIIFDEQTVNGNTESAMYEEKS